MKLAGHTKANHGKDITDVPGSVLEGWEEKVTGGDMKRSLWSQPIGGFFHIYRLMPCLVKTKAYNLTLVYNVPVLNASAMYGFLSTFGNLGGCVMALSGS
jgi:hypothetical protein